MSDLQSENSQESSSKIKTPSKRTPTKRMSKIERAQLESVEVIKSMGGSLDVEGGRRTRSSVRGNIQPTTPATPPPAKKSRQSTTTPRRGRPKKSVNDDDDDDDNHDIKDDHLIDEIKKTPEKLSDENKKDETPVAEPATVKKSDELEEAAAAAPVTEIENVNSKKVEDTITKILPSTDEKSEIDSNNSELEKMNKNNIEKQKTDNNILTIPKVVVTVATPEKQQSTNNVPEKKLDPIEPMEVDSSVQSKENDKSTIPISTKDDSPVKQSMTNNCTSSLIIDETVIENKIIKSKETEDDDDDDDDDVQFVSTNKNENSTDETTNCKTVIECNNVVKEKINDKRSTVIPQNDNKIISVENDDVILIVEDDKQEEPAIETKTITESDDKKEKDSCEPKISSPPPSDGITQPQSCN